MKELLFAAFCLAVTLPAIATDESKEKPIQHLKVLEVTSMKEAKEIFIDKTSEIRSKDKLDPPALSQVHILTYSLEKSVAYFVENLNDERQEQAKELAVVVEDIHLSSENSRAADTEKHLAKYFNLADKFIAGF